MVRIQRGREGVISGEKFLQCLDHLSTDTHPPPPADVHPPPPTDVLSGRPGSVLDVLLHSAVKPAEEMETEVQQHSTRYLCFVCVYC